MQPSLKFKIINHMTMENKANLQSHGRPSLFATWVTIRTPLTYNRLVTLEFEDPMILQKRLRHGVTDYYHVILAEQTEDDLMLSFWVAQGYLGLLVAMQYQSEPAAFEVADSYKDVISDRKLTNSEIKEIFDYIFANPSLIYPVELGVGTEGQDDTQNLPA